MAGKAAKKLVHPPQRRIYAAGRSTHGWRRGARITSFRQLRLGTRIIDVSHQFKAENLAVITNMHPHEWQTPTHIVYAAWAMGRAGARILSAAEFAIWDFDLTHGHFYIAEKAFTRHLRITPVVRPRRRTERRQRTFPWSGSFG